MEKKSDNFQAIAQAAASNLIELVNAEPQEDHGATIFGVATFISFYVVRRSARLPDGSFDQAALTESINTLNRLLHGMVGEAVKHEGVVDA